MMVRSISFGPVRKIAARHGPVSYTHLMGVYDIIVFNRSFNDFSNIAFRGNSYETLEAKEYILNGTVVIENGGRLNIPAGTTIKAREGFSSYLLVAPVSYTHLQALPV